jgi:transcriptional regulator with XRE-family HTH domain
MTHNNKETGMQKTIFVPAYRKLVQELRRARRNAGITQEEVGRRMGRSRQFIHGWETYESRMDAVQICRFARVCGVKAHILVRLMEEELSEEDDSFYLSDVVLRPIPLEALAKPTGRWRMASIRSRVVAKSHTAFCDVRLAQRQPVTGRTAVDAPAIGGHVILRSAPFAHRDELPVLIVQRSDSVLQHGEEP